MTTHPHDPVYRTGYIALIIIGGLLFVLPSLNDGLISDDFELIEESRLTTTTDLWIAISEPGHKGFYRPIPRLLLGLNRLLHGLAPFGYHLLNAMLHIGVVLLIYFILRIFFDDPLVCFLPALLFSIHFVHVEPVYWVSARNELLASLFYLLSIYTFIKNEARSSLPACLFFFMALLCKESVVTLPLTVGMIGLYWKSGTVVDRIKHIVPITVPFWLTLFIYALIRWVVGADWPWTSREIAFGIQPLIAIKNACLYITQMLVPVRSLLDLAEPSAYARLTTYFQNPGMNMDLILYIIPAGLCMISIFILVVIYGGPTARMGLVFALLTALPYLFMQGTGLRYMYLPSAGFLLALVAAAMRPLKNSRHLIRYWPALPLVAVLSLSYGQVGWWDEAGRSCRNILDQVANRKSNSEDVLYVLNLPRRHHGAYVFHNGFEAAVRLHGIHDKSQVIDGDRYLEKYHVLPEDADILYVTKDHNIKHQ